MDAKSFLEMSGYWNNKLYSGNRVFKNNKEYVIDDPVNLHIPEKQEKGDFCDCLNKIENALDYAIEAYNSLSEIKEKRQLIKGSNKRSEILGDPYQQRYKLNNFIKELQLLYKRIENENL